MQIEKNINQINAGINILAQSMIAPRCE